MERKAREAARNIELPQRRCGSRKEVHISSNVFLDDSDGDVPLRATERHEHGTHLCVLKPGPSRTREIHHQELLFCILQLIIKILHLLRHDDDCSFAQVAAVTEMDDARYIQRPVGQLRHFLHCHRAGFRSFHDGGWLRCSRECRRPPCSARIVGDATDDVGRCWEQTTRRRKPDALFHGFDKRAVEGMGQGGRKKSYMLHPCLEKKRNYEVAENLQQKQKMSSAPANETSWGKAQLPSGFPCLADVDCQSERCACGIYGLAGSCAPVADDFRCSTSKDCQEGSECVQDPRVTALFPTPWCKGVCRKK